jgi:MFS transporter, PPP family, 3-phenylpropionic acid transporter
MSESLLTSRAMRVTLVMSCLYAAAGVTLVFLPRWLEVERHLNGVQIGAVLSLAQLARVFTGSAIAHWADGAADRRLPLRVISVVTVAAYLAFFFVAQGFWQLLVLGFFALSLSASMTPLLEAAALRATVTGKLPYGVARSIGSIAFIIANIAGGILVARFGVGAAAIWILGALISVGASSWLALPSDPPPPHTTTESKSESRIGALLKSRRFVIVLLACGLIQSAHAFYYGFSTLVWRGQGISAEVVGLLWAFGVVVEVLFFWFLPPIEKRVSSEALIIAGAAGAVVRWVFMGFAPTGVVLWPLQALHVLSFAAAHIGAMRLIFRDTPESSAATAQTLYSGLSAGLLMGLATLGSGVLYDAVGARGYWAMALVALVGGLLALKLLEPPQRGATATPR